MIVAKITPSPAAVLIKWLSVGVDLLSGRWQFAKGRDVAWKGNVVARIGDGHVGHAGVSSMSSSNLDSPDLPQDACMGGALNRYPVSRMPRLRTEICASAGSKAAVNCGQPMVVKRGAKAHDYCFSLHSSDFDSTQERDLHRKGPGPAGLVRHGFGALDIEDRKLAVIRRSSPGIDRWNLNPLAVA